MLKSIAVFMLLTTAALFHATSACETAQEQPRINVGLYNNRPWPYQAKLISYAPGEKGNSTQTFWLLPFTTKHLRFAAGTKLFLANQPQIDTVMSGKKLNAIPWHIVSAKDRGYKINIH